MLQKDYFNSFFIIEQLVEAGRLVLTFKSHAAEE
jgi:hypothetical protein